MKSNLRRNSKPSSPAENGHYKTPRTGLKVIILITLTILTGIALATFGPNSSAQRRGAPPTRPTSVPAFAALDQISDEAKAQIAALIQEKESRTPAQQKIDSQLLYKLRMYRGESIAQGVPAMETDVAVDDGGNTEVDIRANVDDALLAKLTELNATMVDYVPQFRTIAAKVPIDELETLAAMNQVIFIQPNFRANVWKTAADTVDDRVVDLWQNPYPRSLFFNPRSVPTFAERAAKVRKFLTDSLVQSGSQQSQGDTTHQANVFRTTIGPDGSGIKIGVISDGVANLAASQALGDLGPVTVLTGQGSTGDEGTAMLEIVHDVAPGAELYFASANATPARFAQNIKDLRAAGCDIIIDDIFYFVETPFQDGQAPSVASTTNGGIVIQAVNDVTAAGALYFSSAGNQGNKDDNTSSCYQGDFADGGTIPVISATNHVHNFGGGAQSNLIQTGSGSAIDLYWSDPLGGASNDYDLFVLNNALTTVASSSTNVQNGTQDPFEQAAGNTTNNRVVVVQKAGAAARFLHITINANGSGRLGTSTEGTTKGHSMAANAFSVAATPAAAGVGSTGPFPGSFVSTNVNETFSSDGPRRIFFNADGSAITPGNFSSTGGLVRQKPDITAADGVNVTGVGGFGSPFFGTSAAAPHAGAIAALLKGSFPTPTNAQIRTALISSAIDIEALGVDRDTGAGIIMVPPAGTSLGITAQAAINKTGQTITERPGFSDGDGQVERNERARLVITQLTNVGVLTATGVTATLSSTTPGVVVTVPGPFPYTNIAGGGGAQSNATPYEFFLGAAYTCGTPVDFVLTVNFTDSSAKSQQFRFSIDLSTTPVVIPTTTIDAVAPAPTAFYTTSTGTQTNRVFRGGEGTSCTMLKVFPGLSAATNPRFDSYTFTAPASGCTKLTFTGITATAALPVVYNGPLASFNPAVISANYLADLGLSPLNGGSLNMAFGVTAGQQYTIVVSEVVPNSSPQYSMTIGGSPVTICNFTPTAALVSISGRVVTSTGRGIANAIVTVTDTNGTPRSVRTSTFGYYSFSNLQAGGVYVLNASARLYRFNPRAVNLTDDLTGFDLTAEP